MTDPEEDRTDTEQEMIDTVAEIRGEEWAEDHAELILDQAQMVGELKEEDRQ